MAVETIDLEIRPEDGWVLAATNPVSLLIKPATFHPWWVAITAAGAPADDLIGVPMGMDQWNARDPFTTANLTGEVYVRVATPPTSDPTSKMRFGVIRDEA